MAIPSWRHRDPRESKRLRKRGLHNAKQHIQRLPISSHDLHCLQHIERVTKNYGGITTAYFDQLREIQPTGSVDRHGLRHQGLITEVSPPNVAGKYILLTPKALVLLKQAVTIDTAI